MYSFKEYMASAIHLAKWYGPGYLKAIPQGGTPAKNMITSSKNSW